VTLDPNKPSLPEKTVNPIHFSSQNNQREQNKTNQTIVEGNYTFYNPKHQLSHKDRKINDKNYKKSSHNSFNDYKNFDQNNKYRSYHSNSQLSDSYLSNQKLASNGGNIYDNYKSIHINSQIKAPRETLDSLNFYPEKLNENSNRPFPLMNKGKIKQYDKTFENKNLNEPSTGNKHYNGHFNNLSKLRTINIKEVKEFVPKNFEIVNKESK